MPTPTGFNILSRTPKLVETMVKAQPKALVVLNDLGLAHELTHALPNTIVAFRDWGLGDERHLKMDPRRQIDVAMSQHNETPNLWFYTTNEVGLAPDNLAWHAKLLDSPAKLRWMGLNPAVGTYPDTREGWAYAEGFLRTISANRTRFIFGMHEYAGAVPNSGMPNFTNRIQNWAGAVLPAYHCGRFRYLEQFCASRGFQSPRIILTEHGFDDTFDIKPWLETLRVTAGYRNIRGWKTLQDQWADWYGSKGWSAQRALFEAIKWLRSYVYANSSVEAECIYCWGNNGDPAWLQFDVSDALEFIELYLKDAGVSIYPQPNTPPSSAPTVAPTPAPIFDSQYIIDVPGTYVNVRSSVPSGTIIGKANEGETITILGQAKTETDYWYKVRLKTGIEGWVANQWSPAAKAYRVKFKQVEQPLFKIKSVGKVTVNIRKNPTTLSARIGTITPGQVIDTTMRETSTQTEGMWLEVRTSAGETGWVSLNFLKYALT